MLYEYVATYGDKYRIDSFKGHRELRKDHLELLQGKAYYNSEFVSIGGYPYGGRKFRLLELSITDNPVLDKAKIISRKVKNDN